MSKSEVFAMLKFVPLKTEYLYHLDEIEYMGISERFKFVQEGYEVPEYGLIIVKDNEGYVSFVKVQKRSF